MAPCYLAGMLRNRPVAMLSFNTPPRQPLQTLDPPSSTQDHSRYGAQLVLIVGWCTEDPARAGEVVVLPSTATRRPATLGRGHGDGPRAQFWRQRPGRNLLQPPLEDKYLSRDQLRIQVDGGCLRVENTGRRPLLFRGAPVDAVTVEPGDVFALDKRLLLLCARRPPVLPATTVALHRYGEPDANGIVGEGPVAWQLRDRLAQVAARSEHVLVTGESGTGKELVARAIHRASDRARRPLVSRNAATLPDALLDAELFGNRANYPNPGMPSRSGLVGEAHQSTLFLDEVAELSHAMQAHLLRMMDSGEYQRLGEDRVRTSDLRLVGATNRSVDQLKHDLFARFSLRIDVPPLRERREDIPLLVRHLLRDNAHRDVHFSSFLDAETMEPRVSLDVMSTLLEHDLPTNVRQLRKALLELGLRGAATRLRLPPTSIGALADEGPPSVVVATQPPSTKPIRPRQKWPVNRVEGAALVDLLVGFLQQNREKFTPFVRAWADAAAETEGSEKLAAYVGTQVPVYCKRLLLDRRNRWVLVEVASRMTDLELWNAKQAPPEEVMRELLRIRAGDAERDS